MSGFSFSAESFGAASPRSTITGLSTVAFAALAVSLGCPPDEVGRLFRRMQAHEYPASPQAAVDEFRAEIAAISTTEGGGA